MTAFKNSFCVCLLALSSPSASTLGLLYQEKQRQETAKIREQRKARDLPFDLQSEKCVELKAHRVSLCFRFIAINVVLGDASCSQLKYFIQ
jgi:hypothetical protein